MTCIRCDSERTRKDRQMRLGGQRWRCNDCHRRFTVRSTSAFSHHGFPDDVIALAVRWYVRYRLSYADVVEWFAERGLTINRSTTYRWVQRFLPLFGAAARAHRRQVGGKWRVGALMRHIAALTGNGPTPIVLSTRMVRWLMPTFPNDGTPRRRKRSSSAIDETGVKPERVTTDKAKCYPPALRAVLPDAERAVQPPTCRCLATVGTGDLSSTSH
jgi:IS6 family transposase